MDYKTLAGPRVRQEAHRCLRGYHAAYQLRQQTHSAPTASVAGPSDRVVPPTRHGACWRFYRGEVPAVPGKEYVDDLLAYGGEMRETLQWCPEELERRHDYIQWLFPLRERGVNGFAPLLTTAEAASMQGDGLVMARVLQSFRMMLRFYGTDIIFTRETPPSPAPVKQQDGDTAPPGSTSSPVCLRALLRRTPVEREWAAQYDNLVRRPHNYLRISRILQFLGEVGLEALKVGWLEFLAHEVVAAPPPPQQAALAACRDSFFFWMETPFEETDRLRLQKLVERLATTAPSRTAPVVTVGNLQLPHDLEVSRVVRSGPLAASSSPAPPPRSRRKLEGDEPLSRSPGT